MKNILGICFFLLACNAYSQQVYEFEITPIEGQEGKFTIELSKSYDHIDFTYITLSSNQFFKQLYYELEFEKNLRSQQKIMQEFSHSTNKTKWISQQLFLDEDVRKVHFTTDEEFTTSIKIRLYQVEKKILQNCN